jgi:acyl dehydratase
MSATPDARELAKDIIGTHYRFPDYFEVGREKVREFARAVQDYDESHFDEKAAAEAGYPELAASLTFLAVAGRRVQLDVFTKFDIPINIARVFHRDQKFHYHRPILVGDRLYFDTYLDSVMESHGTVIAEVRSEVTDAAGEPVITSVVTMLGESIHQDADPNATVAAIASIRDGA